MDGKASNETQILEQGLLDSPKLPALAGVRELMEDIEALTVSDPTAVQSVVSRDCALHGEVLRVINTPRYALPQVAASLGDALQAIGAAPIRSLALALCYVSRLRSQVLFRRGIDFLWQTSLMTAVAARELAGRIGRWNPEEAFLAGMMADCGVMVMYRLLPGYRDIVERFRLGEGDLIDLERETLPSDHARVAQRLTEHWGFPAGLQTLLSAQHDPELMSLNAELLQRAKLLKAAWLCARALTVPGYEWEAPWVAQKVAEATDLHDSTLGNLAGELSEAFAEAAVLVDIPPTLDESKDGETSALS